MQSATVELSDEELEGAAGGGIWGEWTKVARNVQNWLN